MADKMTPEERRRCMSRIRGTDTKPEMIVRRWLWAHGFRYRLHVRKLPGSPDIVMRKHGIAIFVNGCFWHGHNVGNSPGAELTDSPCCKIPRTNRRFWLDKIRHNMIRDIANVAELEAAGWQVITVWECDLLPKKRRATLENLLRTIEAPHRPRKLYDIPESAADIAAECEASYGYNS